MVFNIIIESVFPQVILSEQLEKFNIDHRLAAGGEIEISDDLPSKRFAAFENAIGRYSIQILNDEKSKIVQKIKNILVELVHEERHLPVTLSAYLSDQLNLSYGYISYLFSQETCLSIENFIIMLRVERAKRLIVEDMMSLKEISSLLRYSSVGHFSRQFKKTTGITISVFKKIISNKRRAMRNRT